ncbi:MAG: Tim44-like domain-containing protein [Burkholderiales bacterium]|nr:Tim44-like domain-containing protein [Burkholderiales bacterium]
MKTWMMALAGIVFGLGVAIQDAEAAKRLGGGKSIGSQRESVTQRQATPPATRDAQQAQAPGAAAQAAQPRPGMGRWLAPLAGLAAGLGLAYLFGDQMGTILTALLLGLALAFVAVLVTRALGRKAPQPAMQGAGGGLARYNGMGSETVAAPPPSQSTPAGAAPDLRNQFARRIPEGFNVDGFLRHAKKSFVELQAANDRGDLAAIRDLATDDMASRLRDEIAARGDTPQRIDIVTLNADLLELVTEGDTHWASIRFSGMLREEDGGVPTAFEEVWNLQKPASGDAGWLLAGIQQVS